MKKLLLVCTLALAAVTTYGQGQVFFANDNTTLFTTNGGPGKVGNAAGLNTYRIGMYTAPAGTVNEAQFTLTAVATNSSSPVATGRFSYPESPYTFAANNGTAIAVQIRAWSLAAGATYEAAVATGNPNYYGGKTAIGTVTPAINGATPPSLFGPAGAGVFNSGVVLTPLVPEPSTIALGLLGLGAIALFRRRK